MSDHLLKIAEICQHGNRDIAKNPFTIQELYTFKNTILHLVSSEEVTDLQKKTLNEFYDHFTKELLNLIN